MLKSSKDLILNPKLGQDKPKLDVTPKPKVDPKSSQNDKNGKKTRENTNTIPIIAKNWQKVAKMAKKNQKYQIL